jgi:hypothetical protein
MIIFAFEKSPSIPRFLVTKIVYIGYGQLKKMTPFIFSGFNDILWAPAYNNNTLPDTYISSNKI